MIPLALALFQLLCPQGQEECNPFQALEWEMLNRAREAQYQEARTREWDMFVMEETIRRANEFAREWNKFWDLVKEGKVDVSQAKRVNKAIRRLQEWEWWPKGEK